MRNDDISTTSLQAKIVIISIDDSKILCYNKFELKLSQSESMELKSINFLIYFNTIKGVYICDLPNPLRVYINTFIFN